MTVHSTGALHGSSARSGMDIYDLYNKMESDRILLSFKGDVTSDLTASILQIIEQRLIEMHETPKLRKKVYNVLVECLQNLYHHIDDVIDNGMPESDKRSAIFTIGHNNLGYSITTGNYIDSAKVNGFAERLDRINSLSTDELKQFYKEVLSNDERSERGGGGLGMIDIARKTGKKLNYDFITVTPTLSFFSLNINIDTHE
ncbi:MAG: SiaB family protein kinase [Flavobacteriales bacterium]|nr:SiaB family protein kinase [Flavobacteriales bacterium]